MSEIQTYINWFVKKKKFLIGRECQQGQRYESYEQTLNLLNDDLK